MPSARCSRAVPLRSRGPTTPCCGAVPGLRYRTPAYGRRACDAQAAVALAPGTVYAAIPFGGGLDYLARPLGVEFYSPTDCFTVRLPVPEAWPAHAVLQTDNPADMPPLDVIEPHMALFQDQRAKELLVTPKGVRLVYQAAQAEQGPYQTLRLVRFPLEPLDPDLARALMDAAVGLVHDLRDAGAASRRQQPFQPIGQQLERVAAS